MKRSTYSRRESFVSLAAMRRLGALCLLVAIGGAVLIDWPRAAAQSGSRIITTIAGGGFDVPAPAKEAPMVQPILTTRDPQGRGIYIVDYRNGSSLLRFLNTSTNPVTFAGVTIPAGSIGLLAGGGILDPIDGNPLREVDLGLVSGIAADPGGGLVFLGIPGFFRSIYAVNITAQNITFEGRTFRPNVLNAVTSVTPADFWSLTLTNDRRFIVAGRVGQVTRIYRIGFSESEPIAGGGNPPAGDNGDNGPALQARIINPTGTAFDSEGNLWIAEAVSGRNSGFVRRVGTDGIITTVASGLDFPLGIVRAPNGDFYVPLGNSQRIIRISTSGGGVTAVAGDTSGTACSLTANPSCGDGGPALSARFSLPGSSSENFWTTLGVDASGIYVADNFNPHVRYINLSANPVTLAGTTIGPGQINSIVGNGIRVPKLYDGIQAQYSVLRAPHGVTADAQGNVFIGDTVNFALRYINRGTTPITLFAGTPSQQVVGPGQIATLNRDVSTSEPIGDQIITASFNSLQGVFATDKGIYIVDALAGIRFPGNFDPSSGLLRFLNTTSAPVVIYPNSATPITVAPGEVKIIAGQRPGVIPRPTEIGDGQIATKSIIFPADVVVDGNGNIYIADYGNDRIRRINGSTGVISSLFTGLSKPTGVALDSTGRLLVADTYNDRILRQNAAGSSEFTSIANSQTTPRAISKPRDVIAASDGKIYVVNAGGNQVLQLETDGTTTVLAGNGSFGFSGDDGPAAQATLRLPQTSSDDNVYVTANIASLPDGSLIFTDTGNDRIRRVTLSAPVGAFASVPAASFTGQQVAVNSIAAGFGANLATGVAIAGTVPLPKNLLGTTVTIKDSTNTDRQADLFFVSPGQINYLIPPGTALGAATVTVNSGSGNVSVGTIQVTALSPGLFSANSTGAGLAAAQSLRSRNGNLVYEPTATFNGTTFVPVPINVAVPGEPVFLVLYGTGLRANGGLQNVTVMVGNRTFPAAYADAAPGFIGLDQINIGPLPADMAGSGVVNVKVTIATQSGMVMTNTVTVQIQ
jgi:uncharacterized protein (TIGR03437 family)